MNAGRKLEQISDVGDKVGETIGSIVRYTAKHAVHILIVASIGALVFLSSMVYSAWKKKN
jgi:uncharacterized membrane protein YeaQ/YmgE (transglycosylase-associated protein family)